MDDPKGNDSGGPFDPEGQGDIPPAGMSRSDWFQVVQYFFGVLFFIGVFIYMIASGPKGALIGGVSLLAGVLLWVIFRYVLKEIV
jgi:1,4-dihydroxy-2-naphthoate octaprenyltransferase